MAIAAAAAPACTPSPTTAVVVEGTVPAPRKAAPPGPPPISSIPTGRFCPTSGRVDPLGPFAMKVNLGGMRGVVAGDRSGAAELAFTYRGPSTTTAPLANGSLRRQIGLRLRAQDTCNAIYVMWHVEPAPRVAVSVKRNPGQSTHAQCLDKGYINIRPTKELPRAPIEIGAPRTLRAEIDGTTLRVRTDGAVTWEGVLPPEANAFAGPAGIRSDNGEFDFEVRVPDGSRGQVGCAGVVRD